MSLEWYLMQWCDRYRWLFDVKTCSGEFIENSEKYKLATEKRGCGLRRASPILHFLFISVRCLVFRNRERHHDALKSYFGRIGQVRELWNHDSIRFNLLMLKTLLKTNKYILTKEEKCRRWKLCSKTDIPNHTSDIRMEPNNLLSMFCQYWLWSHFSHYHFFQCLPEWRGTSLSPNVSSREEDGLPFSCPVWAEVRPPRQEFTTLLRTQNNPSSPPVKLFAKSFCNPCSSLSLRLRLLFDRSRGFTSNQPSLRVRQISASLKFSFT